MPVVRSQVMRRGSEQALRHISKMLEFFLYLRPDSLQRVNSMQKNSGRGRDLNSSAYCSPAEVNPGGGTKRILTFSICAARLVPTPASLPGTVQRASCPFISK